MEKKLGKASEDKVDADVMTVRFLTPARERVCVCPCARACVSMCVSMRVVVSKGGTHGSCEVAQLTHSFLHLPAMQWAASPPPIASNNSRWRRARRSWTSSLTPFMTKCWMSSDRGSKVLSTHSQHTLKSLSTSTSRCCRLCIVLCHLLCHTGITGVVGGGVVVVVTLIPCVAQHSPFALLVWCSSFLCHLNFSARTPPRTTLTG